MHVTKNVCGSLLGTLLNTKGKSKDHANARADMKDLDIRPELCPEGPSAQLPLCAVNLTKEERQKLCGFSPVRRISPVRRRIHSPASLPCAAASLGAPLPPSTLPFASKTQEDAQGSRSGFAGGGKSWGPELEIHRSPPPSPRPPP